MSRKSLRRLSVLAALAAAVGWAPPLAGTPAARAVSDSIQGIRIGSEIDRVETLLEPFGATSRSGAEDEDSDREEKRRAVWTLAVGDYETIVVESDARGRVTGATGFVRKGAEIPFSRLGTESAAARWTDSAAVWNVPTREGGYRLLARGPGRTARVVTLLSLAARD